jgi:membrane protein
MGHPRTTRTGVRCHAASRWSGRPPSEFRPSGDHDGCLAYITSTRCLSLSFPNCRLVGEPMKETITVVREIGREFSDDECPMMAASLAYYTIFSLAPLLVIVISVAGLFWEQDVVQARVVEETEGVVGQGGKEQLITMLNAARGSNRGWIATLTGIGVLLFGATGVMVQLQYALNKVFNVKSESGGSGVWRFLTKRLLSFAMILAIAFMLLVSLVFTAVLGAVADTVVGESRGGLIGTLLLLTDFVVSLAVTAAMFSAMFKWLPDLELSWRDVLPAGALTSVLFLLGKHLLGLYLGRQDPSAYGPAAALVLILIWVYYSGLILMLGAEFAQVWSRRRELPGR